MAGNAFAMAATDPSLTGIEETFQGAFTFLDAPADVLSAATACRRWRELACADSAAKVIPLPMRPTDARWPAMPAPIAACCAP